MASPNALYGYHEDETLPRRQFDGSRQEIDFDDLYEKRYKKYLQLVAKEQELLRRMTGRRRRQRSSTLGNGLDIEDYSFSESDFTEDEKESCFYRPLRNRQHPSVVRKASSVKDLSSRLARSPSYDRSDAYFSDRAKKRLSVKLELNEDEDGDVSDNSSSSSFSSFSSSPQLSHRVHRGLHRSSTKSSRLTQAHSFDNLSMYSPPRTQRTLMKMRSCEDLLSDDSLSSGNYANLEFHRSSRKSIPRRIITNMRYGDGHLSDDSVTSSLASLNIRRSSHKTTPSANLMSLRNNMLTSSYRNLADRNVRETEVQSSTSIPKTLKTSSPYLERRLAEAKERNSKRTQAMRSLDTDFTKAKEIMKKYKSTENISKD